MVIERLRLGWPLGGSGMGSSRILPPVYDWAGTHLKLKRLSFAVPYWNEKVLLVYSPYKKLKYKPGRENWLGCRGGDSFWICYLRNKYILLLSHHMMLKQQSREIRIRTFPGWGLLVCKKVVEGTRGSGLTFWCCLKIADEGGHQIKDDHHDCHIY